MAEHDQTPEAVPEAGPATAAGILYRAGDRVLLLKRSAASQSHPGTWGFPGGRIEEGETPMEAAVRESREEIDHAPETALTLVSEGPFTLFKCDDGTFPLLLNDEHDGYVWAKLDDMPAPLHPGTLEHIANAAMASAADAAMDESARVVDTNGWFETRANPISKVGIFEYRGRQIKGAPDPDKMYRVYRPAEELSHPDCIASFRLLPWIDDHTMLGDEDMGLTPAEKKGVQGVIGERVYFEGDTLFANLKVFSQSMATLIDAGKRELSCGYRCEWDWVAGTFGGQPYDLVQRQIRGNHIALVKSGRMGSDVAVLDSLDPPTQAKEPPMADETVGSGMTLEQALQLVKDAMPAIAMIREAGMLTDAMLSGQVPITTMVAADSDEEAKKKAEEEEAAKKKAAQDAEAEAGKKDDKDDKKDDKPAMDAAEVFKSVVAQVARRDKLAARLSAHVGTFDHSEMTESDVAAYGVKKLGLNAAKGSEASVLDGWLQAAKAPSAERTTRSHAQDAMASDNAVTRFLKTAQEA